MKSITKRIMECTILAALILALCNMWFEIQQSNKQSEKAPEYAKIINKAIWDKYGPGQKEAYFNLFPPRDYIPTEIETETNSFIPEIFHKPCLNQGFAVNPNAPEWFNTNLERFDKIENTIKKALQSGPFIAAPDESYFTDTHSPKSISFDHMRKYSNAIRQLAYRDWLRGDAESALKRLNTIIGLGESLRYSFSTDFHQIIRMDINNTGLEGFDQLIWTDPDLEISSTIYKNLDNLISDQWELPGFTNNPLIDAMMRENGFVSDQLAASILLSQRYEIFEMEDNYYINVYSPNGKNKNIPYTHYTKKDEKNYVFYDLCCDLEKAGLLTNKKMKQSNANSLMGKWSTLAALSKRCEKLPDAFYESDPLISAEQARKLPKLTYAVSRLYDGPFHFQFSNNNDFAKKRMAKLKRRASALQAAYLWRIERDENGKWLTLEQMHTKFPRGAELFYVVDKNPELLVRHFIKKNIISDYTSTSNVIPTPGFFNAADSEIIYVQDLPSRTDNSTEAKRFRKENHQWMEGMLRAMSPLVQSVTSQIIHVSQQNNSSTMGYGMMGYGMGMGNMGMMRPPKMQQQGDAPIKQREYRIKIKIPEKTYWIMTDIAYQIYSNQIHTNQLQYFLDSNQYEETNEIQLAGWEW